MSDNPHLRAAPYRQFGIVRHTFPEMTWTEKAFVVAFVVAGIICVLAVRGGKMSERDYAVAAPFMSVMCGVLGYWMRNEPGAVLQFLLFPFTGRRLEWPRFVVGCVRGCGVFVFFSGIFSCGVTVLPRAWVEGTGVSFLVLGLAAVATWRVLRKRRTGVCESQ